MDQPSSESCHPNFPPEILCAIFANLTLAQLTRARLVCRRWNQIITETSSSVEKFVLHINDSDRLSLLLSPTTTRFCQIEISGLNFLNGANWWDSIGDSLKSLTIERCTMSVSRLAEILRATTNLRRLEVGYNTLVPDKEPAADFELKYLETLSISEPKLVDMLNIFGRNCRHLKEFSYKAGDIHSEILDFIQAVRNTLEEITINVQEHGFWTKVAKIDGLHLKLISGFIEEEELIKLCLKQPTLKDLYLQTRISDKALHDIGKHLQQLATLSFELHTVDLSTFVTLDTLPSLKHLNVRSSTRDSTLCFGNLRHNKLEKIGLWEVHNAINLLSHFPNLRIVKLTNCIISNWYDLFDSLAAIKNLEQLMLYYVTAREKCEGRQFKCLSNLKSLHTCYGLIFTKNDLMRIIASCLELRVLSLINVDYLDDDVVLMLCLVLKQLKHIQLGMCPLITEVAVKHILQQCPKIEEISILANSQIMGNFLERLKENERILINLI